ncbi:uncharacterized protein LOC127059800 [Serinus canaria]|uniref:uncharacterized protein LOC127059800 n=1 Tax=Serinus canaria TaxID=9135 RepID=UPI0021CC749D|nr:uncharacterized protein LOC127059800 [Serinus canaria]
MRGSRECSAPSPERAARAGARRPRGAASGADTAEPRRWREREPAGMPANPPADAVLPVHDREAPLPPPLPSCLPGAGRAAQQRLGVQHRRNAINKDGHLPSARCQRAGTAPGRARGVPAPAPLLSRSRGKPPRRGGEVPTPLSAETAEEARGGVVAASAARAAAAAGGGWPGAGSAQRSWVCVCVSVCICVCVYKAGSRELPEGGTRQHKAKPPGPPRFSPTVISLCHGGSGEPQGTRPGQRTPQPPALRSTDRMIHYAGVTAYNEVQSDTPVAVDNGGSGGTGLTTFLERRVVVAIREVTRRDLHEGGPASREGTNRIFRSRRSPRGPSARPGGSPEPPAHP